MNDEAILYARELRGLNVVVSPYLAGSKRAIRQGGTVYVSPAMHDLIKNADERELRLLLEQIEMLTIPEMPSIYSIPVTTMPPVNSGEFLPPGALRLEESLRPGELRFTYIPHPAIGTGADTPHIVEGGS